MLKPLKTLTVHQLSHLLSPANNSSTIHVFDVREDAEWAHSRLDHPAVHHLPMSRLADALASQPPVIPHHLPVAVLCKSGGRSAKVAAFLTMLGFDAANVSGGLQAWVAEIDPTLPSP